MPSDPSHPDSETSYSTWQSETPTLYTIDGEEVVVGSLLRYRHSDQIYIVTEIQPTFSKNLFCVGERLKGKRQRPDGVRYSLRTYLMHLAEIKEVMPSPPEPRVTDIMERRSP